MSIQIAVGWKDRLYDGFVSLWPYIRLTAKGLKRITDSYLPGTRPFNRYYQGRIAQIAQERLRLFASLPNLPSLDRTTKRRLLPLVRHSENLFASMDVWHDAVRQFMQLGGICMLFALIPPIVRLFFADGADNIGRVLDLHLFSGFPDWSAFTGGWILLWPVYATVYGLVCVLVTLFAAFFSINPVIAAVKTRYLTGPFFGIGWFMVCLVVYGLWCAYLASVAATHPIALVRAALGGVVTGLGAGVHLIGVMVMISVSYSAASLLLYRLERRRQRLYPQTVVTHQLLRILSLVTKRPAAWGTLGMKRELLWRLEVIASCLDDDLPRWLQSDIATDGWLHRMTKQMAAAQRALKPWVLMPKPDTREQFIARIADALVHAATGEWDALARSEDEPQTQLERWRDKAPAIAKAILMALLPLLILWGVQQSPLKIPEVASVYATIVSLLWLVLTVLTSLDASLHTKVSVMQDVARFVPFLSKWLGTEKRLP